MKYASLFVLSILSLNSAAFAEEIAPKVIHPTRQSVGQAAEHASPATTASGNGIYYHGGPVMLGTTNVYYIFYGNWANDSATTILPFLAQNIGGSSYFNINTSYYNGSNVHVSNSVAYYGSINDNYSQGTTLTDSAVLKIVTNAIQGLDPAHQSGTLPLDTNGVYFVLTSADVNESSGFCTKYCGWHNKASLNGVPIQYSFVGNGNRCASACQDQTVSPNGNAGADGMASVIAHELEESVTDPQISAWYDRKGNENADKCAWTFGTTSLASNGSKYNVVLNGMQFLIQQNWVNASGGYCAMSF